MGDDGASRFSRLRFLCMPGVFDSAGPLRTHVSARSRVAFWRYDTMGVPIRPISELNTQPTDAPVQRFECSLAAALAWLGARVVRYSFPVRLFHSLVGSRAGAAFRRFSLSVAPRFLWECLTNRTVNPFPVPASSNPAGGFPALGFPACFSSRLCGCFSLERLSLAPLGTPDIH